MKLTFKSVDKDVDKWMQTYGTPDTLPGGTKVLRGLDSAEKFVLDSYFEHKAYDGLVAHVVGFNQVVDYDNPLLFRLTTALIEENQLKKIEQLWRGVIAKRKISYFEILPYHKKMPDKIPLEKVNQYKNWAAKGFKDFASALEKIGETEARNAVIAELSAFEQGKNVKLTSKPDPRKIDEDLFWSLIANARDSSPSVADQLESLTDALAEFKASAIRQFQTLLTDKMRSSYTWDIWALGYLAQDGCSDDAFEGFRAWLILQGKDLFTTALRDVTQIVKGVPAGVGTNAEQLLSVSEIAYERRTGKPLPPTKAKSLGDPTGEKWEEETLQSQHPKLWNVYNS